MRATGLAGERTLDWGRVQGHETWQNVCIPVEEAPQEDKLCGPRVKRDVFAPRGVDYGALSMISLARKKCCNAIGKLC